MEAAAVSADAFSALPHSLSSGAGVGASRNDGDGEGRRRPGLALVEVVLVGPGGPARVLAWDAADGLEPEGLAVLVWVQVERKGLGERGSERGGGSVRAGC